MRVLFWFAIVLLVIAALLALGLWQLDHRLALVAGFPLLVAGFAGWWRSSWGAPLDWLSRNTRAPAREVPLLELAQHDYMPTRTRDARGSRTCRRGLSDELDLLSGRPRGAETIHTIAGRGRAPAAPPPSGEACDQQRETRDEREAVVELPEPEREQCGDHEQDDREPEQHPHREPVAPEGGSAGEPRVERRSRAGCGDFRLVAVAVPGDASAVAPQGAEESEGGGSSPSRHVAFGTQPRMSSSIEA